MVKEAPVHRLLELWSWLPAFRFVAETEHLPSASDLLYTSPSALSRTVKQLEGALGVQLFDRRGRKLSLNDDGRRLLAGVRRAMRYVDDVCEDLRSGEARGTLSVNSTTQLGTAWLLRAVSRLRAEAPGLVISLVPGPLELIPALLQGQIDLGLVERPLSHRELTTVRIGRGGAGLYCGPEHPLAQRSAQEEEASALADEDFLAHEFVAPPDAPGPPLDDWPAEVPRRVGLRVDQVRVALEVCRGGQFLAVLPDEVAADARARGELVRLPYEGIPAATVYALRRQTLHPRDAAARVSEVLAEVAG